MLITPLQAARNILVFFFQLIIGFWQVDIMVAINLHYLGQLGDQKIPAAYGFMLMLVTVIVQSAAFGINQTLNIRVSTYQAAGNHRLSNIMLSLALYLLVVVALASFTFISLSRNLLSMLIQEDREQTSSIAWSFLPSLLVTNAVMAVFECLKNYLVSSKIVDPFLRIHVFSIILHALICGLFFESFGMFGVQFSCLLCECIALGILIGYIRRTEAKNQFQHFTLRLQINQVKELATSFFYECWHNVLHIFASSFAFLSLTMISFRLSSHEAAAQVVFSNNSSMFFKVPLCLQISVITYIRQEISLQRIKCAQTYVRTILQIYFIVLVTAIAFYWIFREPWAAFYSNLAETQELLLRTLPYFLFASILFDGLVAVLAGILKALDFTRLVFISTLMAFYILGLPIIWTAALVLKDGLSGIWLLFGVINFLLASYFLKVLYYANWEEISERLYSQAIEDDKHGSSNKETELNTLTNIQSPS